MTSGKGEADTRPPREFANASFLLVPAAELCKSGMPDSRILELFKRCSVLVVVVLHHVTTVVDGRTIIADVHWMPPRHQINTIDKIGYWKAALSWISKNKDTDAWMDCSLQLRGLE